MGRRRLEVSGELLLMMYAGTHHYRVIRDPIPGDAQIVGVRGDEATPILTLILESGEWDGPDEGAEPPRITPTFVAIERPVLTVPPILPADAALQDKVDVCRKAMNRATVILARTTPLLGPKGYEEIANGMDRAREELRAALKWIEPPWGD